MANMPTNEKLLMVEGDDEAWVDTHHGMGESHDLSPCQALAQCVSHDLLQWWSRQSTSWWR